MTSERPFLNRIALGTAQFGLAYGITNKNGKMSKETVAEILAKARRLGIDMLDTAPAYGNSQAVIGEFGSEDDWKVVTKLSPVERPVIEAADIDRLANEFDRGLSLLDRSQVEGLLIHHGNQFLLPGSDRLIALLEELRDAGRVRKIGASVYSAGEIDAIMERFTPDIIQLPVNVADQRLIASGHIEKLKSAGVEIHARSLFLQGVLLALPCNLPSFFATEEDGFMRIASRARDAGISALQLCLAFAAGIPALDRVILGVSSVDEFREIAAAAEGVAGIDLDLTNLALSNPDVLDPSRWPAPEKACM